MTGVDVEHTKALEAAATPGEWVVAGTDESGNSIVGGFCHSCAPPCYQLEDQIATAGSADAEFIAHARTAVPTLVAAVERVQALHSPVSLIVDGKPYGTLCRECTDIDIVHAWECDDGDPDDGYIEHPCPTIRALETP